MCTLARYSHASRGFSLAESTRECWGEPRRDSSPVFTAGWKYHASVYTRMERGVGAASPRSHCRECGCVGPVMRLDGLPGEPVLVAGLPRCGCFRSLAARANPALTELLAPASHASARDAGETDPLVHALLVEGGARVVDRGRPGPERIHDLTSHDPDGDSSGDGSGDGSGRPASSNGAPERGETSRAGRGGGARPVLSVEGLAASLGSTGKRELMVYHTECCDEAQREERERARSRRGTRGRGACAVCPNTACASRRRRRCSARCSSRPSSRWATW